ncbi:MAG: hypothetical protein JJT88_01210 [Gammaproteobacteria bacterium]|nr:hypothetical protein [Gammaproteobacteria bacterium]
MGLRASAPGKMMISGEYSVLSGEPALVMAVDRRVQVTLESSASGWQLRADGASPELDLAPDFLDSEQRPPTAVALALWCAARAIEVRTDPMMVHVDSRALQQAGIKLGLGSSAAVSVALTAALAQHAGLETLSLEACFRAHDALQGTTGSGFDVAAAWRGGCFEFRRKGSEATIATAPSLPGASRFVWTGQAARTAGFVERYRHWERNAPGSERLIAALGDATRTALDAVRRADATGYVAALAASAERLGALAKAAELPIFAGGHEQLLRIGSACGVAYKPCGAGGGDIGIAAAVDESGLTAFEQAARGEGYSILSMECDPNGVRVERDEAERIANS